LAHPGVPFPSRPKLVPGGSTMGICRTVTISAICSTTASLCAVTGPKMFSSAHCTARIPKNTNASAADSERKCASATRVKPSGRYVIAPRTPNAIEESAVVNRNNTENSVTTAASRAKTKERLRTGSTPSVRLSRRSGNMFSQITSVMKAVAVIESSSAIVRSCAIASRTSSAV
jgi:hypothetical protein